MSSRALAKYLALSESATLLVDQAAKLRKISDFPAKSIFLHAALAAYTAAWDAYVKALASEYYSATAKPLDRSYDAMHLIAMKRMAVAREKLNTPNSDNSRNFCVEYTGFDPWNSWANVGRYAGVAGSVLHVRERLNEIFKVRHSFAHGLTMPVYTWNQDRAGAACLTCRVLRNVAQFFSALAKETDKGMALHITTQHGIPRPW
jgi:hypothetical protein